MARREVRLPRSGVHPAARTPPEMNQMRQTPAASDAIWPPTSP